MYDLGLNSNSIRANIIRKLKRLQVRLNSKVLTDTEKQVIKGQIAILKEL